MAARRLILVMLVLLVLSSAVAALIPVQRDAVDESSTTTATTTQDPVPQGRSLRRKLSADRAEPQTIRIRTGDQLRLTVTSSRAGQVEILVPGVLEYVDRFLPAHVDLLPLDTGTYPVRLIPPQPPAARGRVIGRIVVGAKRARRPT